MHLLLIVCDGLYDRFGRSPLAVESGKWNAHGRHLGVRSALVFVRVGMIIVQTERPKARVARAPARTVPTHLDVDRVA